MTDQSLPEPPPPDRFLTKPEALLVMHEMGLTYLTLGSVRYLAETGQLPFRKVGRQVVILLSELRSTLTRMQAERTRELRQRDEAREKIERKARRRR